MRILLLPIALIYHIILVIRHKLYDWHVLKSKRFDVPVIGVGNLALGGTGKTPHVAYLTELLSPMYRLCIVSRGYGRKTKGFQLANGSCTAETIGDEPMQYLNRFNNVTVAVDGDRNRAIDLMSASDGPPEVYLLDDAFQHRSTQAGLNILLTAYDRLYCDDYLVPAGTLRDIRKSARRADIIVVSKTPRIIDERRRTEVIEKLRPLSHQKIFFSTLNYEPLRPVSQAAHDFNPENADTVLLFCGIAHPEPLVEELQRRYSHVDLLAFHDHHPYSENDVKHILEKAGQLPGERKIIVTTEKDLARFTNSPYLCQFESVPLYVAPINISIFEEDKFKIEILTYVRKNAHHG